MRLIAILIALFGGYLVLYGTGGIEPVQWQIGQQWTMIGGGFLFGGLFLYIYASKNINK